MTIGRLAFDTPAEGHKSFSARSALNRGGCGAAVCRCVPHWKRRSLLQHRFEAQSAQGGAQRTQRQYWGDLRSQFLPRVSIANRNQVEMGMQAVTHPACSGMDIAAS